MKVSVKRLHMVPLHREDAGLRIWLQLPELGLTGFTRSQWSLLRWEVPLPPDPMQCVPQPSVQGGILYSPACQLTGSSTPTTRAFKVLTTRSHPLFNEGTFLSSALRSNEAEHSSPRRREKQAHNGVNREMSTSSPRGLQGLGSLPGPSQASQWKMSILP